MLKTTTQIPNVSFGNQKGKTVSEAHVVEQVRDALPVLAEPFRPGDKIAVWMDRASRKCGVPAARLRAFWHRKVDQPRYLEVTAVLRAYNEEMERRKRIAALEKLIKNQQAADGEAMARLVDLDPSLARLAPADVAALVTEKGAAR